ncbi:hypothetical protein [Lysinibacillus sp. G4S2]|uniref:hypothetical protein n=1 Tax=Lysinibacillus sp. G4S2 TaxID=3055859 RepID=UPI0025A015C8|nr:hypothetical protein [Lysinibacillus sp. G4S2]MDM5250319.1 hypothetical protein [Lysinibacillus sp. G4S2]
MFKYAQLNINNVVEGISYLSGEVVADNMILVNDKDVELGSTYDAKTGDFTAPVAPEPIEPQPTVEEMQAQMLLNTEYLVSKSELLGGN